MSAIKSMADFEKAAIKAVNDAGLKLEDNDSALHVGIVKFIDDRATFSVSFTDSNGIDYSGRSTTPELAIKNAINQHASTDIKI